MTLITKKTFALLLTAFAVLSACTTPSKSSKLDYLTGAPTAALKEEDVLRDLARTNFIYKRMPSTEEQKRAGLENKGFSLNRTSTWVRIYPYTKAILSVRLHRAIDARSFKEKWAPARAETEFQTQYRSETQRLITSRQCFAVEINSATADALDLGYWYGTVKQGETPQKLMLAKGTGYVATTRLTTISTNDGLYDFSNADARDIYLYADACGTAPIMLDNSFVVELEPRFEQELQPLKFEWLAPKGISQH